MGRVFHLTKFGNSIIASNILAAMVSEQAKMMNKPADRTIIDGGQCPAPGPAATTSAPPAPSSSAPYALTGATGNMIGKCHVHVDEFWTCAGDAHNLDTAVTIWDVGGNKIG